MKKLVLLLFVGLMIFAGCAEDIIVAAQSELRGAYTGRYKFVEHYEEGGVPPITYNQLVDWTFTDQKFFCTVDDTLNDQWLCDFSGNYALENVLVFSDTLIGVQTCDRDRVLVGDCLLRRYLNDEGGFDSLEISQVDGSAYTLKTVTLYPASE